MDEAKLLEAIKATVNESQNAFLEKDLKKMVGEEVAKSTRNIVEQMAIERAAFGYDRSGLTKDQKINLTEGVKALMGLKTKANEEMIADIDSRGGLLLSTEVASAIQRISFSVGAAVAGCTPWDMTTETLSIPAYTGSVLEGAYLGVNVVGPLTAVTFKQADLISKTWQLAFAVGNKLLRLSPVALADWLLALAGEARANMIDKQVFAGTGLPFVGILNHPDATSYQMASGQSTFSSLNVVDDLANAQALLEESILDGAAFYCHRTNWAKYRVQKDDAGQYLLGIGGLTAAGLSFLLKQDPKSPAGPRPVGYVNDFPVYTIRHLPANSATAVSTNFAIFGNLKCASLGMGEGMRVEQHNSGNFGKEIALADQTGFVIKEEHAAVVHLPAGFVVLKTAAS